MAARPLVTVQNLDGTPTADQVVIPPVLTAPIRLDTVHTVFLNMNKNARQAYAVNVDAGMQHSAESWGTGRAVARIPRVSGGGTSRSGQAAFGNMCRKGRMFAPTKTWRKWHRKISTNQKRYAVVSALAASALPALVMARGHNIQEVPEVPLVLSADLESISKTSEAVKILKAVGAYSDVARVKNTRTLRAGKGKMRNRRYVQRIGPLVVYQNDEGLVNAVRNLPGVDTCHVDRLNLLQLAPGGHIGRFIIWTAPAFNRLNAVYGSTKRESETKKGYKLPQNIMTNTDLVRIINSDAIQSALRPVNKKVLRARRKKNPLKNLGVRVRLNPYSTVLRRAELLNANRKSAAQKKAQLAKDNAHKKKNQKNNYVMHSVDANAQ